MRGVQREVGGLWGTAPYLRWWVSPRVGDERAGRRAKLAGSRTEHGDCVIKYIISL